MQFLKFSVFRFRLFLAMFAAAAEKLFNGFYDNKEKAQNLVIFFKKIQRRLNALKF